MYSISKLLELINLPKSYLELAIPLLKNKETKCKVLKTLFNNRKKFSIILNERQEDILGYCKIVKVSPEFVEFHLAIQNKLITQLL